MNPARRGAGLTPSARARRVLVAAALVTASCLPPPAQAAEAHGIRDAEIEQDIRRMLRGNFERWTGMERARGSSEAGGR